MHLFPGRPIACLLDGRLFDAHFNSANPFADLLYPSATAQELRIPIACATVWYSDSGVTSRVNEPTAGRHKCAALATASKILTVAALYEVRQATVFASETTSSGVSFTHRVRRSAMASSVAL